MYRLISCYELTKDWISSYVLVLRKDNLIRASLKKVHSLSLHVVNRSNHAHHKFLLFSSHILHPALCSCMQTSVFHLYLFFVSSADALTSTSTLSPFLHWSLPSSVWMLKSQIHTLCVYSPHDLEGPQRVKGEAATPALLNLTLHKHDSWDLGVCARVCVCVCLFACLLTMHVHCWESIGSILLYHVLNMCSLCLCI